MIENYKSSKQLVGLFLRELERRNQENQKKIWNPRYPNETRL
jgi:hypothetical protein